MKAVVYAHPREFTVKNIPTPNAAPGQVLARIVVTGICGTDLHIHNGNFFASFPLTPGHEPVGIIEQIGAGVTNLRVGEQVAINGNWGCGKCYFCQRGKPLQCKNLTALGVTGPGGFAEYMLAPAGHFFPLTTSPPTLPRSPSRPHARCTGWTCSA